MSELSPADVLAMERGNDGLFGGNCGSLIILILFFLMMGGGGGWFGNNRGYGDVGLQNSLTRAEMADGFTMQNVQNDIKGIYAGMTNGFADLNQNISAGFANAAQCCCETNRNIDSVRFENAKNTCAITSAIHDEAEKTRALFTAQQIQDLRDRLQEKDNLLQSSNLVLANAEQTKNLLSQMGRFVPYAGCANVYGGF